VLLFLVSSLHPSSVEAADSTAAVKASITVMTLPDSALLTVDSLVVGRTPLTVDSLAPGRHRLRLVHPDFSNWLTDPIEDTVHVLAGERRTLRYRFDEGRSLVSFPSGAEVFLGDSLLGSTPLTILPGHTRGMSPVRLHKNGFSDAIADFSLATRGVVSISLTPEVEGIALPEENLAGGRWFPRLIVPGALAVLSGGLSAYFKVKADNHQTAYLATGDLSEQSERERLDTLAAVFLVAMQASVVFLITFLVSE
jgi:PEGA domain